MTTDVTRPRKILAYLTSTMTTFETFKAFFPFDLRKVFLAIKVRFKVIRKL